MKKASQLVTLRDGAKLEYVISMDDIDLRMLPQLKYQRREETVPLWSARSSGPGAEYFEFEVLANEDGNDADRENARVQRCHVCDVDVPLTYWMDHQRSVEHRTSCSIADISLDRTRKQMSLVTLVSSSSISSTYYCPSCSCAVDLTKRNDHESSQQHSKSIVHNKLLQSLSTLYQNKNNLDEICKNIVEIVNKDVTEKQIDDTIEKKDIQPEDASEDKIDEVVMKGVTNEDVQTTNMNAEDEVNQKDVIIMTVSKAKLKVSFDNYQGFCTVRGYTQCRVCRVVVDDKMKHLFNEEHRRKVEAVIKDKHCIRKLDRLYNHCILCNEVIESPEAHIQCSQQHNDFLKKALFEDHKASLPQSSCYIKNIMAENLIKNDDANELNYFCDACQIYFDKATLLDHVNNDGHQNSLKGSIMKGNKKEIDPNTPYCSLCDVYMNKGKKVQQIHFASKDHKYKQWLVEKDTKIHYHMRKSAFGKEVVCHICNVQLNNNSDEIKEHVNSNGHQLNREIMLKNNYMENKNNITVFCIICNETEYMIDEIQHVMSKSHSTKLENYTALGIQIGELKQIIKSHENSKFKQILHVNRIEDHNVLQYRCKACSRYIYKTIKDIFDHIFSKKHKKFLRGCTEIAKKETATKDETLQENTDDKINEIKSVDLHQPFDKKETIIEAKEGTNETKLNLLQRNQIEDRYNTYYRCNVCDRLISKSIDIQIHISSKKHKDKLDQFSSSQNINPKTNNEQAVPLKLETIDDNDEAYSVTVNSTNHGECVEDVARKLEANWIEKRRMKNDIRYYCEACEAAINSDFETHILLERHRNNISKINKLWAHGVLKNGLIYYCTLCQESVKRSFEEIHLLSESHKKLFEKNEYLNTKGLCKISRNYFCEICLETIQLGHEYEHIESEPHKANIQITLKTNAVNLPENLNTNINKQKTNDAGSNTIERSKFKLQKPLKKLHYLFETNPTDEDKVTCLVCNFNMPLDKVIVHRKDKTHKEIYMNVMDTNTMFRIKHRCFCECCREIFKVNCEYIHLTSEHHRLNLARNTERMDKKTLSEFALKMFNEDIRAERKALLSDEKYAKLTSKNFESDDSDDDGEYRFENLNNCMFLNSFNDLQKDSDEEGNSVSDSNDGYVSTRSSVALEEIQDLFPEIKYTEDTVSEELEQSDEEEDTSVKFAKSMSYLFEEINNPLELLCKLCHCVVANCSIMILEHIVGVKHAKKYECILLINELKETIDNRKETILKYRCQACGTDVEKIDLFGHINSNNHKLYLTAAKPSTSGSFQHTGDNIVVKEDLKRVGQTNAEKNKEILTTDDPHKLHLMKYNSSNELFCKLCDSEVTDTYLNNHINSRTHQIQFESYLLENDVKKVGVTFFCVLCKIGLAEGTELEHLYEDKHKTNYLLSTTKIVKKTDKPNALKSKMANGYVCTACDVEIPNNPKSIQIHYNSNRHKTNVTKAKNVQQSSIVNFDESKSRLLLKSINSAFGTMQTSNVKSEYFCEVCSVKVPNNLNNIKMHNDGGRHKSKLTEFKASVAPPFAKPKEYVASVTPPCAKLKESLSSDTPPIAKLTESNPLVAPFLFKLKKSKSTDVSLLAKYKEPKPSVPPPYAKLKKSEVSVVPPFAKLKESVASVTPPFAKLKELKPSVAAPIAKLKESEASVSPPFAKLTKSKPAVTKKPFPATDSFPQPTSSTTLLTPNSITKPAIWNYVENGFCHICKTNVEHNIDSIKKHLKGKTHNDTLNALKLNKECTQNSQKVKSNSKQTIVDKQEINNKVSNTVLTDSNPFSVLSESNVTYVENGFCHACKIELTNNISCIEEHVKGKKHVKNVKYMNANASETQPLGNEKVKINENQPSAAGTSQNIVGKDTKTTLNNNDTSDTPLNVPKGKCFFECTVCKTYILNTFEYIFNHYQEQYHIEKFEKLSKEKQMSFYSQVAGFVLGNLDKAESINAYTAVPPSNNNAFIINNTNNHNIPLPDTILKSQYYDCKICKLKVPNNPNNIQEHIKGTRHKNNVDNLVKMCPVTEGETKGVYTCQICNLNITDNANNIAEHCIGKQHKMNVENVKSDEGNKINCRPENRNNSIESQKELSEDNVAAQSLQGNTKDIQRFFNKISKVYDSDSHIACSNKTVGTDINKKITRDNLINEATASTSTLPNIMTDNNTNNSESPNCDKSNEGANTENTSNTIPTTNININNVENYSEMQISESKEHDISNDCVNMPSTSKDESSVEILKRVGANKITNISGSHKTEEYNTENILTSKADVSASEFVTLLNVTSPEFDNCETNDNSNAKTELNQDFYECNVSQRTVPSNQIDIKSHLSSYHHQGKSENNLKDQEDLLPNAEEHFCDVCEEKMPNYDIVIKYHDGTQGHKKKLETILLENKIKIRDDIVCFCEACDLYFSKVSVKTHIDKVTHKYLLEAKFKESTTE